MALCHRESGAQIITVAVRRVRGGDGEQGSLLNYLTGNSYFLLPNPAGLKLIQTSVLL